VFGLINTAPFYFFADIEGLVSEIIGKPTFLVYLVSIVLLCSDVLGLLKLLSIEPCIFIVPALE